MSKYWHQTPHWIKSITNVPSLHRSFAPWLFYRYFPEPGQRLFFFWMDRFFIRYFPGSFSNCNHLSADDGCRWLPRIPVFPRCFCLNVFAGIAQDLVRPRLKWGQTMEKLTAVLACSQTYMSLLAVPKWVSLHPNATATLHSLCVTGSDWRPEINESSSEYLDILITSSHLLAVSFCLKFTIMMEM